MYCALLLNDSSCFMCASILLRCGAPTLVSQACRSRVCHPHILADTLFRLGADYAHPFTTAPLIFRPSYGPAFPNVKHWWGHNLFAYSRSKTTFPYMPNVPSLLGKNLIAKIVSPSLALSLCMSDRTSEPSERMRTLRNWYSPYFGRLIKHIF